LNLGSYRPHVVVADGEYLGVEFVSCDGALAYDEPRGARFRLLYWPEVEYSVLQAGVTFTIREGPRIVGRGRVLGRTDNTGDMDIHA
jgi:hypothetical protein